VHRHRLVVGVRTQDLPVRAGELCADQQRLDSAGAEECERREQVEEPDPLVVDCRQPAEQAGALLPDPFEAVGALARALRKGLDGYLSASR
jgi:hypothetical protein